MSSNSNRPATGGQSPFASVGQIADHLGVATKTVRGYIRNRSLPAVQIGRTWRIRLTDYEQFLEQHRLR